MNPKQRAVAALELRQPDDIVPTFEFGFAFERQAVGWSPRSAEGLSGQELDRCIKEWARFRVELCEKLDWSILTESDERVIREIVKMGAADTYLLCVKNGDSTYRFYGDDANAIMTHLYDRPDEFKRHLDRETTRVIEYSKKVTDLGVQCFVMGADYAGTKGPFLSPQMFAEFVKPFLHRTVEGHQSNGAYVIKHADGDIEPILDQMLDCGMDGLHSVDPTAGIDIAKWKKKYGRQVCLCGNVDCGALMRHDRDAIRESAIYCLTHAKPAGGFIYVSSNSISEDMRLEDYLYMLELRQQYGRYDGE